MKNIILVLAIVLFGYCSFAQTLTTQNTGNQLWIKLGDLALPQGGNDCFLRIVGGSGYNALKSQQGYVELHMRTSNGASVDENGYGFSATAVSYERNRFIADIRIVPNASGTNATSYGIFIYCGPYPGSTFFSVEDPTGIWTSNLSSSTTAPGGYSVPFEHVINNNTFLNGNLGIGTTQTDAPLTVNGTIHATEVLVDQSVPHPDYVFDKDYDLIPLKDVKYYIDQNHHLPEIPSTAQVAKEGINLGEMNAKLLKKIEELTLYLIEKDKKDRDLQSQVDELKKQILSIKKK
ncbi:hypothetical protein [Mucilaginibacter jinjuensis]|uniref:Uncharacterized protein n=1 Tax=Mucilaginibacter jinjuensis TaxID=1176721 RepID=A0ABY7TBC0_9SPHI|nr:hypothetical protein [Mucilaginibacter jinjuensis]WCT13631.1 hypothetical protein PQO05_06745 [Mucilaginibacter jinjuensis]